MRNVRHVAWLLGVVLLLMSGCEPTATPTPTELVQVPTPTAGPKPMFFIPDQVIVTGPEDEVNEVVQLVQRSLDVTLKQIGQIDLRNLAPLLSRRDAQTQQSGQQARGQSPARSGPLPHFPPEKYDQVVINLYTISDAKPVDEVVRAINGKAKELGTIKERGVQVFADPNYVTGGPPVEISGDDPWCWEADPFGGRSEPVDGSLSQQQWAFGAAGIGLYSGDTSTAPGIRPFSPTGKRVRVGVFDTSPFSVPDDAVSTESHAGLTLRVAHPKPKAVLTPPPGAPDVRDHGLFVAGQIHEVAPDSEIYLYRVLRNHGKGDLFTLTEAIKTFIEETLADKGMLAGAVVNLSLGIHPPPDLITAGLPPEVVELETIIYLAEGLDFVVVAASGNDSNLTTIQAMQLPAVYPVAIGVAASNAAGGRACFSNRGDVAAPGGDGSWPACKQVISQCGLYPEFCVVGLSTSSPTGFAYWTGTSFATPLVSALAALILDAADKPGVWLPPSWVAGMIYQGAVPTGPDLGAGIISLPHTLMSRWPPP
ncbi:MAG: S8 family serine peptidase [Anaerolineae bacterium]